LTRKGAEALVTNIEMLIALNSSKKSADFSLLKTFIKIYKDQDKVTHPAKETQRLQTLGDVMRLIEAAERGVL